MNNSVYPCITLKGKVAEAAEFYTDVFKEAGVIQTSPFVIQMQLFGQKLMLLNDGPTSQPNASVSFMVMCDSAEDTEEFWFSLSDGGTVLMALDSYPWSPKYGWIMDKYGVSWQLYTNDADAATQKVCPTLMFTGAGAGKASEAVHFYTRVFPDSAIEGILKYAEGEGDNTDFVKHAQFTVKGYTLMAMDSSANHGFSFNDAISLVVECEDQAEIDRYWEQLTADGGQEVACGWLTDKYGISWQIIPKVLAELMKDKERIPRVMGEVMKMKKLIIEDMVNA